MTEHFLEEALRLAEHARDLGEVPIGAVVVRDNEIIGRGFNTRQLTNSVTGHAEMNALLQANHRTNSWRLVGCQLISTLEPCLMCTGALVQARIDKVYFGCSDPKGGCCGGRHTLNTDNSLNHSFEAVNLQSAVCSELLKQFFASRRKGNG